MTDYTSVKTGNWNDPTVWDAAGWPDGSDDNATIANTHTVTVNVNDIINGNVTINAGGTMYMPASRIYTNKLVTVNGVYAVYDGAIHKFSDLSGAGIIISSTGQISVNGTPTSNVVFRSTATSPTNRWTFKMYAPTTTSTIKNLQCVSNNWWVGDSSTGFEFSRKPQRCSLDRVPAIDSDLVLGRDYGRVFSRGREAAVLGLEGTWDLSEDDWQIIETWKREGTAIGISTEWMHIPHGRILDHSFEMESGSPYADYSLEIIEDR